MTKPDFFTRPMHFAWLLRSDVRKKLLRENLSEEEAHKEFVVWWLVCGRKDYPENYRLTEEQKSIVNEVVAVADDFEINRIIRFLIRIRDDVRQNFKSDTKWDWNPLLGWYFLFGVPEYDLFHMVRESDREYLASPAPGVIQDATLPVTRLMHWVWLLQSDISAAFPLNAAENRERFVAWFYIYGLREYRLFGYLDPSHAVRLYQPPPMFDGALDPPITRLMWYHWLADPEIRKHIDLRSSRDRLTLKKRLDDSLRSRDGFQPLWDLLHSKNGWMPDPSPEPAGPNRSVPGLAKRKPAGQSIGPLGVNLVGYAMGELGIGEDVRMMARALEAAGVDFCILNRQPGPEIRQMDFSAVHHLSRTARYPVTIICMTAFDTALLWLERPDLFRDTHVIGFWPWELPQWPKTWEGVYELVDEIWCSSRYTFDAFAGNSPVPVRQMPMAVVADARNDLPRTAFGLPDGRFLFLFVFDFMSYPARKNPYACIAAFREAFPQGGEPVNLVLKVSNVVEDSPNWQRIKQACEADPRILIFDRNLDKASVIGLMQACDAYVSLHRAEGFGRTLAEAMLLEKPVIATGYSGNADFLGEATGYPVDYDLVEIEKDDYPCGEGQFWAEPRLSSAAERMRQVYFDCQSGRHKGRSGKEYVLGNYSPDHVGRQVSQRLAELADTLAANRPRTKTVARKRLRSSSAK